MMQKTLCAEHKATTRELQGVRLYMQVLMCPIMRRSQGCFRQHERFNIHVGWNMQGNQLFSPVRTGNSQARNAARKLDMNAVTPTVQPSPNSPQRFSARHAS